ncbi:hypothetical protein BTZ20_4096 [Rhodococcus sp. MTM3W5.2]|nr:hypothetical protein BTZ20_4096 [Rhodococcus sp. MTM3W5.2]
MPPSTASGRVRGRRGPSRGTDSFLFAKSRIEFDTGCLSRSMAVEV